MIDRRVLLAAAGATPLAAAAAGTPLAAAAGPRRPAGEQIALWPGLPPGAPAVLPVPKVVDREGDPARPFRLLSGIDQPVIEVHRATKPDGSAALIIPGGAYSIVAYDNEGLEQARWLTARGTTVFVLLYRLPGEGWRDRAAAPLQDATRAMRLIRARAAEFRIDPARVMVLGFSAGGHLAGSLATAPETSTYAAVDAADELRARPDFAALLYPVVSLVPPVGHAPSAANLLGPAAGAAAQAAASVDRQVSPETPPLFLAAAADDDAVDPENSLLLWRAAQAVGVSAELHLFPHGGHGFGTRLPPGEPAAAWPLLLTRAAAAAGVFTA